jgi:hypothetical protein
MIPNFKVYPKNKAEKEPQYKLQNQFISPKSDLTGMQPWETSWQPLSIVYRYYEV